MQRVIFVNRYFYPDQSATSRLLSDLGETLAAEGFEVHVVTSRQLIDDRRAALAVEENWHGVRIHRVWRTMFGRARLAVRALDYLSFHLTARRAVARLAQPGAVVVAKTDPPLLSVSMAGPAHRRGATLVVWLQDVFPEVATALGVLSEHHPVARLLKRWRDRSLVEASMNVVLGSAMAKRVHELGVPTERITIIPNWANGARLLTTPEDAASFRDDMAIARDKFVVGYCGNLGRVHEFETLLDAAVRLRHRADIAFVLVGAGAQADTLRAGVRERHLGNVQLFAPQPELKLAAMLAAMDAHVVCLAPALEGLVVPSKIYGVMAVGRPVLNVAALDSELSTLVTRTGCGFGITSGDADCLAERIEWLADHRQAAGDMGATAQAVFDQQFERRHAVSAWRQLLASLAP
jgi:colanic acid biosynthesis glycosyl transferase WcaI